MKSRNKKVKGRIGSLIIALLLFPLFAFSQDIEVSLEVSEKALSLGDFVELNVIVQANQNAQISEPRMPNFADLSLQGQSRQVSDQVSIINGEYKFVRNYRFQYTYRTEAKGQIDIPPIPVEISGKTYKTDGYKLKVLDPAQAGKTRNQRRRQVNPSDPFQGKDPFEEMEERFRSLLQRRDARPSQIRPINPDEAFSIRLQVDKERAYVGEQVTASYFIYVPGDVALRSIDTLKFPSLNQFWKEDIEISTRLNFEPVSIEGRPFKRALLASYALFPIRHGSLVIDPYKAKCSVASQSVFGFGKTYTYTKSSKEKKIQVLPLPDANQPSDFAGAVGDFNISANLEEKTFKQGEPFTLTLKIEGRGNAKVIEMPTINFPDNLDFFDSKEETKFFPNGQSFKEFTLYLVPLEEGSIEIPAIDFHYFNPESVQYVTKSTKAIRIQARPGSLSDIQGSRLSVNETDSEKTISPPPIFSDYYKESDFHKKEWLYLILGLFTLCLIYFSYLLKRDYFTSSDKKIFLKKVEKRKERLAKLNKPDKVKDYAIESLNFLYFLLGENLKEKHSSEKIAKSIQALPLTIRNEVEEPILRISDHLQALAFAPDTMTQEIRKRERLKELNKEIDRVAKKLIDYHINYLLSE